MNLSDNEGRFPDPLEIKKGRETGASPGFTAAVVVALVGIAILFGWRLFSGG
jgi:hypothetical protein